MFLCARERGRENRRLKFTTNGRFCNLAALEVGEEPGTGRHAPSCTSALPPPCCCVPRDSIAGTQEKPFSKQPLPSASSRCKKGNVGVSSEKSESCAPRRRSSEGGDSRLWSFPSGLYSNAIVNILCTGKVLFLLCRFQPTDIWGAAFFVSEVSKNLVCLSSERQAGSSVLLGQLRGVSLHAAAPVWSTGGSHFAVPSGGPTVPWEGLRMAQSWQYLTPVPVLEPCSAAPGPRVWKHKDEAPYSPTTSSVSNIFNLQVQNSRWFFSPCRLLCSALSLCLQLFAQSHVALLPAMNLGWAVPGSELRLLRADVLAHLLLHHSSSQTVQLSLKVNCTFDLKRETVKRDANGFYRIQLVLFFMILWNP